MKTLSKIILMDWYLIEGEEWDINGHTALLGANGSGKSSFIDAMQYVLLGGNKSDWSPNAKASEQKHARDLRSYVLGLVKDEQAITDNSAYKPRENGLCRIVLVFKDIDGYPISIGAAVSATKGDPNEQVEGFFILKGYDLSLSDMVDNTKQGMQQKSYEALKAYFRNCVDADHLFLFGHEPSKFVDQMLRVLGGEKRFPAVSKYRRSFKQSLNISGLESVSDFVKQSILDEESLNIDQMRESITTYRNKQKSVERAHEQIKALEEIQRYLNNAHKSSRKAIGYLWCKAEMSFNAVDMQIEALEDSLNKNANRYFDAKALKIEVSSSLNKMQSDYNEISGLIKSDQGMERKARLEDKVKTEQLELSRQQTSLASAHNSLSRVCEILIHRDALPGSVQVYMDKLQDVANDRIDPWPTSAGEVDSLVSKGKEILPNSKEELNEQKNNSGHELVQTRRELNEIGIKLERLQSGQSDLTESTLSLIKILSENGIQATPVCELVEVTKLEWQPAIESFLRDNAEALIVPVDQATEAVAIYRKIKKQIFGATVINTAKVQHWQDTIRPNTAATLIEGENEHAVKYLQRQLRNIELIDSTNDIMQADRALTTDRMFVTQGGVKRLAPPRSLRLGSGAREKQIKRYEEAIDQLIQHMTKLDEHDRILAKMVESLTLFSQKLKDMPNITSVIRCITEKERSISNLKDQVTAIDTSHLKGLLDKQLQMEDEIKVIQKSRDTAIHDIATARSDYRNENHDRHVKKSELPQLNDKRKDRESHDDFLAEVADKLMESLEEEFSPDTYDDYNTIADMAGELAMKANSSRETAEGRAKELFGNYQSSYQTEGMMQPIQSMVGYRNLISDILYRIRDIGLHERQQDVIDALLHVQRIVRSDLLIRLQGQFEQMNRRIDELNRELNNRPFSSNQIYRFHRKAKSEYKVFVDYVKDVKPEDVANFDGLFDEGSFLNEFIEDILDEEKGVEFSDYRNYFIFDIQIHDPDSGITEYLSRKMGSASGGEHKTPLYVAIGASLASAFRIERQIDGSLDGGFSLYLADEAFEKMDTFNTIQASRYLKSIGLQMFIAAPDDAEAKLRQVVDTVLFFTREKNIASISVDYVTPDAKNLLASATSMEEVTS